MKQLASPLAGEAGQASAWPGEGVLYCHSHESGNPEHRSTSYCRVPAYGARTPDSRFRGNKPGFLLTQEWHIAHLPSA